MTGPPAPDEPRSRFSGMWALALRRFRDYLNGTMNGSNGSARPRPAPGGDPNDRER
jgi:hypothetical protein